MLSLKNGVLNIHFDKKNTSNNYRRIFEICFFCGIVFHFLYISVIHYLGVGLFLFGTFLITIERIQDSKLNNLTHSAWYLMFIILAEISTVWAYSPTTSAFRYANFMMLILVIGFGMAQYVMTPGDAERLIGIYAAAAFAIALIEFAGTPFSLWFEGFFGGYVSKNNTNTFGYIVLFGSISAFYKAYVKGKRLWYLPMIIMLIGCVLSSSRKAAVMSIVGILFIVLFSFGRKHHFLHFFALVFFAALTFVIIMTNDTLYGVLGKRFSTLMEFMNDNTMVDFSLHKRDFFIEYAHTLFARHPIIGNGFANFAELLYHKTDVGRYYAHNNYWEILADLGIVGFITYYWFYAYILVKLAVDFVKKGFNNLTMFASALIFVQIILEWGVISMQYLPAQIVIALVFVCTQAGSMDDKKMFYYNQKSDGGE